MNKMTLTANESLLDLDTGKDLQLSIDGISFPVRSRTIGISPGKFIIITPPSRYKDVSHKLNAGTKVIVRYLSHGEVVAFPTELLELISSPASLIFLKFPTRLIHRDIRSTKRVACLIPVLALIQDTFYQGVITDISIKGCQCVLMSGNPDTISSMESDTPVILHFKFLGATEEQKLSGTIKNYRHRKTKVEIGIEFEQISDEFQGAVTEYIDLLKDFFHSGT